MRLSDIEGIRRLREAMGEPPGDIYWHDRQVDVQMMAEEAIGHILDLCSAIETQSPSVTNEFVENARKRARHFIEGFVFTERKETSR
jgi:hypothetical protein